MINKSQLNERQSTIKNIRKTKSTKNLSQYKPSDLTSVQFFSDKIKEAISKHIESNKRKTDKFH